MPPKQKLLIIIGAGIMGIFTLLAIILGLATGATGRAQVLSVGAQQQEIARISEFALEKDEGQRDVRALASNAQLTAMSNVVLLNGLSEEYYSNPMTEKELAQAQSPQLDERIEEAIQTNDFDEEVAVIIGTLLTQNNQTIDEALQSNGSDQIKLLLQGMKVGNLILLESVEAI